MISYARQNSDEPPDAATPPAEDHIAPAPRVSVQAFCETVETAAAVQSAGEDRRLGKAHLKIQMGGMIAAIEAYRSAPTPYVIAPVTTIDVVRSICNLFSAPEAKSVGRIIAVVGAKGGVGASTIAHNVAWAIARDLALDSVVADLDLAFGTAGLDYNQDPSQGIADAVFSRDRVDTAFNDRAPLYCLNQVGIPKRPEIPSSEFAKAIESPPIASIPFEPQMFGSAANNGQMIAEISANHRTTEMFLQIAQRLTGRGETKKPRGSFLSPLIEKLRAK